MNHTFSNELDTSMNVLNHMDNGIVRKPYNPEQLLQEFDRIKEEMLAVGRKQAALVSREQTLQSDLYNLMVVFFTHFNKRLTQCEKKRSPLAYLDDDNLDDNWGEEDTNQGHRDDSLYVNLGNNIDSEDYPSKKVISIATPEQIESMVDRFKKKKSAVTLPGGPLTRNGNYVSNFAPIKEMEIKSREKKDMQRTNNRIQFKHVADFVHLFLVKRLEFHEDQNKHEIPRRMIVEMYQAWCKMKNRKILVHKPSTLHMSITNQIKIAFPQVYVQNRMYKGLKFKEGGNDAENSPANRGNNNNNSSSTNANIKNGNNAANSYNNPRGDSNNFASLDDNYFVLKEEIQEYSDKDCQEL